MLLTLQATDQELAARRRAQRDVVSKLEAQGGLPELRDRTEKARVKELQARVEHAKMEAELAGLKDRVNQLEERLYSGAITNVKELQAIESEHSMARKQYVTVEQGLGPALAMATEAKGRHEALKAQLEQADAAWKAAEAELKAKRDQMSNDVAGVSKKRALAAAGIPPKSLASYESLLSRKAGVAVVRVERGVCQGCRVKLPVKELAGMRVANGLVSCSSCGRILLTE